ncbi:S-layer homology domain-containing protein [Paenibacillus sedimenti]|uniref:S-layer homology domain-containing protein n=1 Tax=Paenibacillus sedimenti TaxID=2770274 RepID=A0A926KM57_9BACL|nr:S-layer homology domain-containing protein [Paenibacillus sedimenti]MBD0378674.1 S-layer homology domain-containing protein [Paenibacillus sedimenti]
MRKEIALILSFMLFCYCFSPFVYAEEAASASPTTPTTSATPSTKPSETKPAASSETVTSDTYLADQLSDLKGLSKDDKKKINVLLKMDAIEKAQSGTFGVDDPITRAQLAKTATLVLGLTIDSIVTLSTFSDIQSNDPARSYIEALKKASLTYDTVDNKYNPTGAVTRQELAMLLVKGLGLDEKAKAADPVKDETVETAYKSYVAYALQQKIMTNQTGGKFGGNVPVTRKTLALAAYEALKLHTTTAKPSKVSIAELKVIGKNKLSVRLNRDIDIDKAVLSVTKAGFLDSDNKPVEFEPNTTWSDDNMTATLEMSDDFEFAQYHVVLSGVDVANGTMAFMPENERAAKVEFVTATDKLSWSKALIEYKAVNQYGENMKLSPGNMSIYVGAPKRVTSTILADSNAIVLDLSDLTPDSTISVNLLEKSGYISVGKSFTVGDIPQVKKVDLGDTKSNLKLPAGQLVFQAGGRAYLTFKAYDQYGNRIVDTKYLNMGIFKNYAGAWGNVFRTDGPNDFIDFDNDGYPELQLAAYPDLDSNKEVTVKLIFNGEEVSQTVTVATPKSPYTVVIGPLTTPLTEGDQNKEIGLKVIDSANKELDSTEIAPLEMAGKISVYATGGLVLEADPATRTDPKTGQVRNVAINLNGTIRVKQVTSAGPATINVRINGLNQTVTYPLMIEPARKPNTIKLDEGNSARNILLINTLEKSKTNAVFKIYDQFDEAYSTKKVDYKVEMKLEKISGVTGAVYTTGNVALSDANPVVLKEITDIVKSNGDGQSITFKPNPGMKGTYKLTATLVHLDSNGQIQERLSSDSVVVDVDDQNNPNLTYALDIKSGDLLAIGRILYDTQKINSVTNAVYLFTYYSALAKDVNVITKDALGLDTGLSVKVRAVTSDNPKAMAYSTIKGVGKIIGLDSGKFNFTVYFDTPNGVKSLTQSLGSGVDSMFPSGIKAQGGGSPKTIKDGTSKQLNGLYLWDKTLIGELRVETNSYGTFINICKSADNKEAKSCAEAVTNQDQINPIMDLIGMQAFIGDIVYNELDPSKQDSVSINPELTLNYTRNPKSSNPDRNNIQQFTMYLVGGTQMLKYTIILGN